MDELGLSFPIVGKPEDSKLQRAVRWAAKLHRGQDREGTSPLPYITHPIDVMNRLRYLAQEEDEEILCAAALHDVVEECGTPFAEIEERFGARVAGLVKELTRQEPTEEETAGLAEDQVAALRSRMLLDEIAEMSADAQRVKLADRLSNLSSYLVTRRGEKLARYVRQSYMMLEIVPREVSPALWDGIQEVLKRES